MCCFSLVSLNVLAFLIFILGWPDLSCCKSLRISQQAKTHHPLKLSTPSKMPGNDLWPLPLLIAAQALFKPQAVTAPCSAPLHPFSTPPTPLGRSTPQRLCMCVYVFVCVCGIMYDSLEKKKCAFSLTYNLIPQ